MNHSISAATSATKKLLRSKFKVALTLAAIALAVWLGHSIYQRSFPGWDEEVLLSDGRMLLVHRAQKFNTEGALIETVLTFDLPEMGGKQTWREHLSPSIVDIYEGRAYVVGHVTHKFAYVYKAPKYGYVAYTYGGSGWQRIPFISLPIQVRQKENMASCATESRLHSWQSKQSGWCNQVGEFVQGAHRDIDLAMREKNARDLAELSRSTPQSE